MLNWEHNKMTYKPSKLGQTDLVYWVYNQSSSLTRSVHARYKSLCVAVMICVTLVNTETAFDRLYY